MKNIITEIKESYKQLKSWPRASVVVIISVLVLQTIAYYITSRAFFRREFFNSFYDGTDSAYIYEYMYWIIGDALVYMVLPFLIIKFYFKERIKEFGINFRSPKLGFKFVAIALVLFVPVLWVVTANPEFRKFYPMLQPARTDISVFILYEGFILLFMLSWEFFVRGFTLFGLKKDYGSFAVLLQTIPFVILHNGKPFAETLSSIPGGIILGFLAYRTGSVMYGVIIHFSVLFCVDLFSVIRNYFEINSILF